MRHSTLTFTLGILALALGTRFLPHFPNFTAIGAVALLGGQWFRSQVWGLTLPLVLLYLSDILLNNIVYSGSAEGFSWGYPGMAFVYAGHVAMIYWGQKAVSLKGWAGLGHAAGANLLFFLLSNIGYWYGNPALPQTAGGFGLALVSALPFYASALSGTIVYGAAMQWAFARRHQWGWA